MDGETSVLRARGTERSLAGKDRLDMKAIAHIDYHGGSVVVRTNNNGPTPNLHYGRRGPINLCRAAGSHGWRRLWSFGFPTGSFEIGILPSSMRRKSTLTSGLQIQR